MHQTRVNGKKGSFSAVGLTSYEYLKPDPTDSLFICLDKWAFFCIFSGGGISIKEKDCMVEHIRIFGAIITLSLGIFVGAKVYWTWKSFNISYMKWLLGYIICFNLGIGLLLVIKYIDLNLSSALPRGSFNSIKIVGILGSVLCLYGMTRFTMSIIFDFLKRPLRFWIQGWIAFAYIVFGISIVSFLSASAESRFPNLVQYIIIVIIGSAFALEFGSLIGLLVYSKKLRNAGRVKIERSFAILFLFRYVLVLLLTGVAFLKETGWFVPITVYTVFILINLLPLGWVYLVQRNFTSPALHESLSSVLKGLGKESSISKREYEVLKLILEGKSNKEIEAELFISQHTVKNHIYNLYQKLGINSRYQLIKLLFSHHEGLAGHNKNTD